LLIDYGFNIREIAPLSIFFVAQAAALRHVLRHA
jgi:hypothetical protein